MLLFFYRRSKLQLNFLIFIFSYLNYGTIIEKCTISTFFWLLILMKSFNDTEKFMGLILAFLCLKMEEYESRRHHLMMHYSITIYTLSFFCHLFTKYGESQTEWIWEWSLLCLILLRRTTIASYFCFSIYGTWSESLNIQIFINHGWKTSLKIWRLDTSWLKSRDQLHGWKILNGPKA